MAIYKNKKMLILFILPALALVILLIFLPVVLNVYYSFFKWTAYSKTMEFNGVKYYIKLFTDEEVWSALLNNVRYAVVSIIFQVGLGLILAHIFVICANHRYAAITRVVIFIPAVISLTAIGLLWVILYSPTIGIVNPLLEAIGLGSLANDWLGNPKTAMYAVIAVSQWQYTGEMIMLYTVGLQSVPTEIYESAKIDGANGIQSFFHITIPSIKSTILMNMTVTIIGAFMVFDEVYVMTSGGPGKTTEVLATMMYETAPSFWILRTMRKSSPIKICCWVGCSSTRCWWVWSLPYCLW